MPCVIIFGTSNWVPSDYLIYLLLIMGGLLSAGVAISVFSFYEDHYWDMRILEINLDFIL